MIYSAGIIPVRFNKLGKPEFLMLRAWNYWDFPKGKVEDSDSDNVLSTAIREAEEEVNLKSIEFTWGMKSVSTEPYATKHNGKSIKKIATYFLAEASDNDLEIKPNPQTNILEHEEFRWFTYEDLKDIKLSDRIRKVLDWAYEAVRYEYGFCKDCLTVKHKSQMRKDIKNKSGFRLKCLVCQAKHTRQQLDKNPNSKLRLRLSGIKSKAIRENIQFELTIDYLIDLLKNSDKKCIYCECDIKFSKKRAAHNSISLDRIKPSLGYTEKNVVYCCHKCNTIKNNGSYEDLKRISDRLEYLIKERNI